MLILNMVVRWMHYLIMNYFFLTQVMDFINDAIVSMDAFVTAYKPAAVFFSSPVEMRYRFNY